MSNPVGENALLQCSFGSIMSTLHTNTMNLTANNMKIATMMDFIPNVNIKSFGMCRSLLNPAVASATAAAYGVLTMMPCVPLIISPWMNAENKIKINGMAVLMDHSKCQCVYGGSICVKMTALKKIKK